MLVFKLQKKDLKYEFRHRIIPNETFYRNKHWGLRLADITAGVIIGIFFYYFGGFLQFSIKVIVTQTHGDQYYNTASTGSVNTTPPPPPPNPVLIWIIIIVGILMNLFVVAFSEEFCFRGVLLKELDHINPIFGVIASSAIFMIYHVFPGIVPIQTFLVFWLYYFSFGVLLALIAKFQKGDLIIPIFAHATFDSILWINLYLNYLH